MDKRLSMKHLVLAVFHKLPLVKENFELAFATNKRMGAIFNVSPIIIPTGDKAPPEIPKVIFKTEKGKAITVSQIVTNIQIDVLDTPGENPSENILSEFLEIGNEAISLVVEDFECGISRIGVVLVGNLELDTTGAEFIKETYLKGYDEQLFGSEVHWLTQPSLDGEKINRWVRVKSDSENGVANKFIEVIIDSNIMHEPERTVSIKDARDFFKTCINDINDNFNAIIKSDELGGDKDE